MDYFVGLYILQIATGDLMMRQNMYCLIIAVTIASFIVGPAHGSESPSLKSLVTGSEDTHITTYDLAFILATHGYDATPERNHVDMELNGRTYKFTPNGDAPGLASMTVIN
jgi:hypothetical protein